jgi:Flp pilus assembly protein TadG
MEMTFPHFAQRQDSVTRSGYHAMLAAAIARQASSRTVRAIRQAETAVQQQGDAAEQRIQYFAQAGYRKVPVRGAFWRDPELKNKSESGVYHAGSTNIKVHDLEHIATGEQLTHAGHGARKI